MPNNETLVFDVEADGFLDEATKLHSIQLGTVDGDDVTVYADWPGYAPLVDGLRRLSLAMRVIGHGCIRYDVPLVNRLYPGTLREDRVSDTLVMARLFNPEERSNSLLEIGMRLGCAKGDYAGPWDVVSAEMLHYAAQDIRVTRAAYHAYKAVETWGQSLALETETAWAIAAQERNGFLLDVPATQELEGELRAELEGIKDSLRDVFPAIWVPSAKVPFYPKRSDKRAGYVAGCPVSKVELQAFNPASRAQIANRFKRLGWRPKVFGKDGTPTIDETTLAGLPYPEAKRLVVYFEQLKKLGQISDGKNGWLKLVKPDGRVYGAVNPNGAATGRMSHFAPNMAQVNKDKRLRRVWLPRPGWVLVGIDADGLEARMLAHYLAFYDGGTYRDQLLTGSSKLGTDVHSRNRDALNCVELMVDREGAKRCLYAYMYGAGDWKLGWTIETECRRSGTAFPKLALKRVGAIARKALESAMTGLGTLVDAIKAKVKSQGYLVGLDGRHIAIRSEHSALNFLLQGAGAIVMKKALCLFMDSDTVHEEWPDMGLCANVHDEVQIECLPELANRVGEAFKACITAAGEHFNMRMPLAGNAKIGANWSETH